MSVTIGTNLDTGMTSITFNSTGRTVQFTPEESEDFKEKIQAIKIEGNLHKESIGLKSLHCLQLLGESIEEGDPETISAIWCGTGQKIVENATINGLIQKEEIPNPFALYHINSETFSLIDEAKTKKAIKISNKIKELLDKMIKDIKKSDGSSDYFDIITPVAEKIISFENEGVGVGDTETDSCICNYVAEKLADILTKKEIESLSDDFYNLIH
jgi:hypothetical protein